MANTYGNSGNRWWVGLNVTSNLDTFSQTLNPRGNSTNGYESLPSGDAADDSVFAKAATHNAIAGVKPSQVSVESIEWFNIQGPFTTQKLADAAIPAIQKANPAPGVVGQLQQSNVPGASLIGGGISAVQHGIGSVTDFLTGLTSANLWIRVAKVVIGGMLLIVGLVKLTGADKTAGGIAAKAVKIAPLL